MSDSTNPASRAAGRRDDRRDEVRVIVFLLLQACGWFAWSSLMHAGAPGDNVEQLNWAHSFEFGYFKHPPMPTWVLYPLQQALGSHLWITRLLGQASVALALWIMWRAMRILASREAAFVALIAGSCITYFSSRGHVYNHNTAMLPPLALACFATLSAVLRGAHRRDWVLLGVATGLGMLVKYQLALYAGSFALTMLACGTLRDGRAWRGLALALAIATLLFAPHIVWLVANDFPPIRYAAGNLGAALGALKRITVTASFVIQQVGRALPTFCVLGLAVLFAAIARRRARERGEAVAIVETAERAAPATRERLCLLLCCVGPALLTIAFGLVAGAHLQNHWGTGMLLLMLPLLAAWLDRHRSITDRLASVGAGSAGISRRSHVPLLLATVLVQLIVALLQLVPPGGSTAGTAHDYTAWPAAALGREALTVWREVHQDGEPALIVGPDFEGGLVSESLASSPPVLIGAVPSHAPWVSRRLADACGALLVDPVQTLQRPGQVSSLPPLPWGMGERIVLVREVSLVRRWRSWAAPIVLRIGVIAPLPGADPSACRAGTQAGKRRSQD